MFYDIPDESWYTASVNWAAEQKIVSGYGNGTFGPSDSVTREQLAVILYHYAKWKGYGLSVDASLEQFSDRANLSPWAEISMKWAVGNGFMLGMDNNAMLPQDNVTRAQMASILMSFCENAGK